MNDIRQSCCSQIVHSERKYWTNGPEARWQQRVVKRLELFFAKVMMSRVVGLIQISGPTVSEHIAPSEVSLHP